MERGKNSATPNSATATRQWRVSPRSCTWLVFVSMLLAPYFPAVSAPPPKKPADIPMPTLSARFSDAAHIKLIAARKKFQADTNSVPAAWALGQACFWRGEFAQDDDTRKSLANEGIAVCRALTLHAPTVPEGHYYLALNLGQLARTKWLEALGIVKELEHGMKLASGMNPRLDHAGPDRCLGQLYRDAPGWPISVGSKSKTRAHLLRAVELAPKFPRTTSSSSRPGCSGRRRKPSSAISTSWPPCCPRRASNSLVKTGPPTGTIGNVAGNRHSPGPTSC